jgi:hypothetical protein
MDEDRLTPQLGRLIDAAKAAAGGAAALGGFAARARREGWAVLGVDGGVHAGQSLAAAVAAAAATHTQPEAAAFAVAGEAGETLLPAGGWLAGAEDVDPELPVVVKYLGRWVVVTLGEIPGGAAGEAGPAAPAAGGASTEAGA